jgi:acyl phosphate:glycerol-3-phosphate acyltransferase
MSDGVLFGAATAAAYLIGSIPTGVLLARARGIDIRAVGSGNIGATNVARNLGKRLGVIVLLLDAIKGAIPVAVALLAGLDARLGPWLVTAVGIAAIVGHCFPVWLRLRGGKGVATSLGVFLVVDPLVAGIGVAIFAVLYALFRIASIGSMVAALSFPALLWALGRPDATVVLGAVGAGIVLVKHRGNLVRLFRREELRV